MLTYCYAINDNVLLFADITLDAERMNDYAVG
jgi:hypothetical protein